jgi:hypothetical protein
MTPTLPPSFSVVARRLVLGASIFPGLRLNIFVLLEFNVRPVVAVDDPHVKGKRAIEVVQLHPLIPFPPPRVARLAPPHPHKSDPLQCLGTDQGGGALGEELLGIVGFDGQLPDEADVGPDIDEVELFNVDGVDIKVDPYVCTWRAGRKRLDVVFLEVRLSLLARPERGRRRGWPILELW